MELEMEQTAAEIRRLKACINDLLSVLTLPAIWSGHEPSRIASTLLDALLGMLRLDFAYFRLSDSNGGAPIEMVRVAGRRNPAVQPQEVGRALNPFLTNMPPSPFVVPNPVGEGKVSIVPLRLTLQDQRGILVAGSQRADFPTDVEVLLLRSAANQAGIGLREARRLTDQEHTAQEARQAHLWFLESIDSVNRAIQGTNDLEQMMRDVLDAVLSIFNCDRAWLIYPCDPKAASWQVPMERTRPEFPGAFALGTDLPMDADAAKVFQTARASSRAVRLGPGSEHPVPAQLAGTFSIQSIMAMALYPKVDKPYLFGLHQCSYPRNWEQKEERLFQEMGRRLEDALTSLLMFRNLRHSEAKLEEAQRIAHVAHGEQDFDVDRIALSEEGYRILGLQPQERALTLAQFQERVHPDDREIRVRAVAAAMRGGNRYDVEYRVVRPSGEVRIVHSQGDITRDDSGRARRTFGTIQDVTERRQEQEALQQREQELRKVQRLAQVGSWQWEPGIDLITWSEETYRIFGYAPNLPAPSYKEHSRLFTAESWGRLQRVVNEALRAETPYAIDLETVRADGTTGWLTARGEARQDNTGRVVRLRGTMQDITERKRAEEALRRSEAYLADAQKLSRTGSFAVNVTPLEITHSSDEHSRLYGFDAEKGVPSSEQFQQRMHPEDRDRVVAVFNRAVAQRTDYEVEFRMLLPDGAIRYAHGVGHPVFNSAGDLVEYVGTVMDVSDRRRSEQERERLRQAEADLTHISRVTTMGELTASLAHEITQPIAAALTNANACRRWLTRDLPDLDEARQAALRVAKDLGRASDIISRIRLLFKKSAPKRELVDVNEVIRDMIVLLSDAANRFSISIRPDVADALPKVMADRVQLQQVLMNLMLNGIDAMRDMNGAGELTVKSQRGGDGELLISVSDTGVGLPLERADQIFNAFFSTKPHGTGMGLPISRSIVEAHGGRLWAAPNSGRGATFQFTLPSDVEGHQ
jgi:PAS domain S-box-containing protein